jgi:translocator protein
MPIYDRRIDLLGLGAWGLITFIAAALGAIGSMDAGALYPRLDRPDWAPPAWLFSPVWTVLYAAMALAAWLVWRERGVAGARGALTLYVLQLIVNVLWSWLFFAWRQGALALADIVVLVGLVVATLIAFWRVRTLAGVLLIPYLAWIGFAAILNFAIWQRNPDLL